MFPKWGPKKVRFFGPERPENNPKEGAPALRSQWRTAPPRANRGPLETKERGCIDLCLKGRCLPMRYDQHLWRTCMRGCCLDDFIRGTVMNACRDTAARTTGRIPVRQTKTAGVTRHRPFCFIVSEFSSLSRASLANRARRFARESYRTQVLH